MATICITGSSDGIGLATARVLLADGHRVLIHARSRDRGRPVLEHLGGATALVVGDLTKLEEVHRLADQIQGHGPLDVLVHNAATGVIRAALETEDKHWDWTLNANARALLTLARHAAPTMPEGSSIVAISSMGGERVLDNYSLVGTSKAALESLVRYLAVELAPRGIRVNAVSAGLVETGALEYFPDREAMLREFAARTPAGRLVDPDDIAGLVCFLASPAADMIRGQTVVLDGGYSLPA